FVCMWCVFFFSYLICFFFFQAEDGIRDRNVTGVQTCALPISSVHSYGARSTTSIATTRSRTHPGSRKVKLKWWERRPILPNAFRSEERRVGKECRYERGKRHRIRKVQTDAKDVEVTPQVSHNR